MAKAHKFGYARVSTEDQDLTVQIEALEAAGCDKVYAEKKSGTKRKGRTELELLIEIAREGDTVMFTRVDRLARSMRDLQNIIAELKEKGVFLKATEQPIDTSTAAGKAFFDMLGVFAEFETNIRHDRQMEGIKRAIRDKEVSDITGRLKYGGRAPTIDADRIRKLRSDGLGPVDIAKQLKIARSSVYRLLDQNAA